jgi:hypothetical protein
VVSLLITCACSFEPAGTRDRPNHQFNYAARCPCAALYRGIPYNILCTSHSDLAVVLLPVALKKTRALSGRGTAPRTAGRDPRGASPRDGPARRRAAAAQQLLPRGVPVRGSEGEAPPGAARQQPRPFPPPPQRPAPPPRPSSAGDHLHGRQAHPRVGAGGGVLWHRARGPQLDRGALPAGGALRQGPPPRVTQDLQLRPHPAGQQPAHAVQPPVRVRGACQAAAAAAAHLQGQLHPLQLPLPGAGRVHLRRWGAAAAAPPRAGRRRTRLRRTLLRHRQHPHATASTHTPPPAPTRHRQHPHTPAPPPPPPPCAGEAGPRSCDCQAAFTVWPPIEQPIRRQPSIPGPSISHSSSSSAAAEEQYPPLIPYQLNIGSAKLRWQQVVPAHVQQSALQKQLSVGARAEGAPCPPAPLHACPCTLHPRTPVPFAAGHPPQHQARPLAAALPCGSTTEPHAAGPCATRQALARLDLPPPPPTTTTPDHPNRPAGSQNSVSKDLLNRTTLSPLSWSRELDSGLDEQHSDSASEAHPETPHVPMSPSHKAPGGWPRGSARAAGRCSAA